MLISNSLFKCHFKAPVVLWDDLFYQAWSTFLFHEIFDWFLDKMHISEWKILDSFVIFVQRWRFELKVWHR